MNLSIIIPLYNESESLSELHKLIVDELDAVCVSNKFIAPPETAAGKAVIAVKD